MDMGPYYMTALVNLLGSAKGLTGLVTKSFETRTITSEPKCGTVVPVEYPHVNGILQFTNGAVATVTTTFDVYYDRQDKLEIYGTEGDPPCSPNPNGFGGSITLLRPEEGSF